MTTINAKKTDGKIENPPDCKTKGICPCNAFERCRKRRPYGSDVWSDGKNKAKAMGAIAFDGNQRTIDEDKLNALQTRFQYRNQAIESYNSTHEKKWKFNQFFANLRCAGGKNGTALVLPKISDPYITQQMNQLKSSLYNTALFTDFQRSMVVRANLVRNNLTIKSDTYRTQMGEQDFDPKDVFPYAKGFRSEMWSVDHVQIRSKGGCNRFCNAAVLMLGDNSSRNDNGPGCPCITAVKEKDEQPETEKFGPKPSDGGYNLYVCVTYHRNKKEGEPPKELPGICSADKPCNLDDPRQCTKALAQGVIRPVYKKKLEGT